MKIQIVIPCINLWHHYTLPCLNSIDIAMMHAEKRGIDVRVLLIDNASTDDTVIQAGLRVSNTFAHLRNEEQWGFQKSINYGINDAWARGFDICLVVNNDILLHPRALIRIVERYEKSESEERLGMITCMDIRGETTPNEFSNVSDISKENVPESLHPNFSAFSVTPRCWEEVGEFDELFEPAYFEDNDFHYRMKLANIKSIVYPPALFYHFGSRTQNEALDMPIVSTPMFENNRAFYVKKWGGVPGEEKFTMPYGDPTLMITSVKQNT